jgi:hypothetical protein
MSVGGTHFISESRELDQLVQCLYLNQGALIVLVTTFNSHSPTTTQP